MLLSIATQTLSVLLNILQFLRQSRSGLKVATGVALLLISLIFWGAIEQRREHSQDTAIRDRAVTHIDWVNTEAYLDLLNDPGTVAPAAVMGFAKIISPESKLLRPVSDPEAVRAACAGRDGPIISALPEELAERLFRALERPEGAYAVDERKAGIDHLYYFGKTEVQSPCGRTRVKLELEPNTGPNATSNYLGLSDLNGKVIVAVIQAMQIERPMLSALELDLKTSAGPMRLSMPAPIRMNQADGKPAVIATPTQRFVGVCIPEKYFGSARG